MICNHYRIIKDNSEFLLYGEDLPTSNDDIELLHEDVDPGKPEYQLLQIIHVDTFFERMFKRRTREIILEEEGIICFIDLLAAYELLKRKQLNKSARVRKLIEEKYAEVIQFVKLDDIERRYTSDQSSD